MAGVTPIQQPFTNSDLGNIFLSLYDLAKKFNPALAPLPADATTPIRQPFINPDLGNIDLMIGTLASAFAAGTPVFANLTVTGTTTTGDLAVVDDATVGDALTVVGLTTTADITVTDDATIGDLLTVTGSSRLNGGVDVNTSKLVITAAGNLTTQGNIATQPDGAINPTALITVASGRIETDENIIAGGTIDAASYLVGAVPGISGPAVTATGGIVTA